MPIYTPGKLILRKDPPVTWAQGGDLEYTINVSGTTYMVHEFRTVGTSSLSVLKGGNFEYLIVGGGGAAGRYGAGGGAGGLLTNLGSSLLNLSAGNYPIIVGRGGLSGPTDNNSFVGDNGVDSSAFNLTAIGGGGGQSRGSPPASNGGSGGGSRNNNLSITAPGSGTVGPPRQGYDGGAGLTSTVNGGAGGGGAGGPGQTPVDIETGGNGGAGIISNITGVMIGYAGGGGGSGSSNGGTATDGGGSGGSFGTITPSSGRANSGGGGGSWQFQGLSGGSGIVIVRYAI